MRFYRQAAFSALLLAFVIAGCSNTQNDKLDPPSVATIQSHLDYPQDAPAPAKTTIYKARPQSEIDLIFSASNCKAPALTSSSRPASLPPESHDVIGLPEWNVDITREWLHIVIHHSASPTGSAASFDKAHRDRGWEGLGYHFVIGNGSGSGDGEVEVGYRWKLQKTGAHAGNAEYNEHGIGICLVGDFEGGNQPTSRQMASLRQLVRFLQVKTGIPTSEVIGHCNVPPPHTMCPGNLDMNAFRASLGGDGAIGIPIHYVQAKPAFRGNLQAANRMALP